MIIQLLAEIRLNLLRHIAFRQRSNHKAVSAYRQAWANWRSFPLSLAGRLPRQPVSVLDLCCGTGASMAVLAFYCASGSRLMGLQCNSRFVARARSRTYRNRLGDPLQVAFQPQSVLDPFCDAFGRLIQNDSIDMVNGAGALGCHFGIGDLRKIVGESARVLRSSGLALVDCRWRDVAQMRDLYQALVLLSEARPRVVSPIVIANCASSRLEAKA